MPALKSAEPHEHKGYIIKLIINPLLQVIGYIAGIIMIMLKALTSDGDKDKDLGLMQGVNAAQENFTDLQKKKKEFDEQMEKQEQAEQAEEADPTKPIDVQEEIAKGVKQALKEAKKQAKREAKAKAKAEAKAQEQAETIVPKTEFGQ